MRLLWRWSQSLTSLCIILLPLLMIAFVVLVVCVCLHPFFYLFGD